MDKQRRAVLKTCGGLGAWGILSAAGIITPQMAVAEWNKNAFEAKELAAALSVLSANNSSESKEVTLTAPEIAENGLVVPIGVATSLSGVEFMAILIEKNPTPLTAMFKIGDGTIPDVQTRCKMAQTSNVIALVKAGGKFYSSKKEVKVTLGGCGG